jgi:catechol 2,3-dioxygenase-like lactoylglutathione lyase family enzyme
MNLNQVTLPACDMQRSTEFYRRMGFLQIVDTPHYARFECPGGGSTFSLGLVDRPQYNPTVIYFEHGDLDELVATLQARGVAFEQEPTDMPYLWREAILQDPAGNRIKLYRAGDARRNPPWRVERRDHNSGQEPAPSTLVRPSAAAPGLPAPAAGTAARNGFIELAMTRPVVTKALQVALLVGTLLALINHGGKLLTASLAMEDAVKIALTFLVPYGVSTWSAVRALQGAALQDA